MNTVSSLIALLNQIRKPDGSLELSKQSTDLMINYLESVARQEELLHRMTLDESKKSETEIT